MPAYWVARAKINDLKEYTRYTDRVPEILEKYNGKVLARGGEYKTLEGTHHFERYVVIEFASMQDAEACFNSPEYKEAAAFRRAAGVAENELTIVTGGDTHLKA